ncbi:hypothetical protein BT69DRAFT_761413 [Atractiella rhizophila]|nr:hypothetical protein BT69DRAFT_761413 [Atractiella rhizophila]
MENETRTETESEVSSILEEISTPFPFNKLPPELQICIIESARDLDSTPPTGVLLSLSCVSKSLRELVVPFLFRELRISTARFEEQTPIYPRELDVIPSKYLDFARSVHIVLVFGYLGQTKEVRRNPWEMGSLAVWLDENRVFSFCTAARLRMARVFSSSDNEVESLISNNYIAMCYESFFCP